MLGNVSLIGLGDSPAAVCITFNRMKVGGETLAGEAIQALRARIERGEFGEEMKKLPEEERIRRVRELRRQREASNPGSQTEQ